MMTVSSAATVQTADGPFTVVASSDAVLASGWTDDLWSLVELIHTTLRPVTIEMNAVSPFLARALAAVEDYYGDDLLAPCDIPVKQYAGPFHLKAWEALRAVKPGETVTYTELAERAGNASAVRAAGSACAFNAAALFVPCHRVVRADNTLGGYRYGLPVKQSLLIREQEWAAKQVA
ncbi:MAG: methylated-DNA--[protein]-cysteine S-methyltransferase [Propionibacteriaceae bacterium]|jgi:methylated-DNA-[protein]-cysteine S-methyltransferase|nr:methylated-DNA--[protein]-cysteine S-methyltransferase [Propionibacteriaceae bacterium]